jgi:hypothetical protein
MKKLFLKILLTSLLGIFSLQSYAGSSISFVTPSLKITFPKPDSIIQFFATVPPDESSYSGVAVHIQVPDKGNGYYDIFVGTIGTEETPYPKSALEIVSVFLEKIDETPEKALFIIAATEILHRGANTEGKEYSIYVFKHPGTKRVYSGLPRLTEIEKQIGGGFHGTIEGDKGEPKPVTAPYTNAADVRKILRKLGYLK